MVQYFPVVTGSLTVNGDLSVSGNVAVTGSLSGTSSLATNAINAFTASTADNFIVRQALTGSNALFSGAITAQTLVVQTVTSSILYTSGSNRFGSQITDRQTFTGSMYLTGSIASFSSCVGIGIANPTVRLQVSGTMAVGDNVNGWGRLSFDAASNATRIQSSKDGTESVGLSFWTQASGGGFAERMSISGSNVGIGTSNPSSTFHVKGVFGAPVNSGCSLNGVVRFGQTSGNGGLDIGFGDPYSWLQSRNAIDYSVNYNLSLQPNGGFVGIGTIDPGQTLEVKSADGQGIRLKNAGSSDKRWDLVGSGNDFRINEAGVGAAVSIKASGNVGIGTTSPATKLHVSGPVGYGGSTYPQSVKFVKSGSNSVAFTLTIPYSNNWAPASATVRVAGSRTGLEEHYAGLYLLRLTYYGGSGVTLASYFINGTDGVTFSMSANISNPQTFTLTINDAGASTDYLIADLDISVNGGIISIS